MSQTIDVDTKTFIRFWLVLLGFAAIALFIRQALTGLIIVGISIFLAIAIKPLAVRLSHVNRRIKPATATILSFLLIIFSLGLILATVGPAIVNETVSFIRQLPSWAQRSLGDGSGIDNFGASIGIPDLSLQLQIVLQNFSRGFVTDFGNAVVSSIGVIANFITSGILVLVLTLLFLLQGPKIANELWKTLSKQGDDTVSLVKRIVDRILGVISKYVHGQVTVAILDGVVVMAAVALLAQFFKFSAGLAFPLGMLATISCLIPMFGPIIGCGLVSILLFFSSLNLWTGITFLIFYIIYQQFENNYIAPKIQGNALNLPPLIILIAVTIGIYSLGIVGAIVAIPIAGCIKVLLEEYPNIRKLQSKS